MPRYKYSILTFFLICTLLGPFILRLKDPRLEAYPAVLFPSGAEKIITNKESFSIYSIDLYGYNDENSVILIDKKQFLKPIPIQYLFTIQEASFGLKEYIDEFKLYKPPIKFTVRNHFSPYTVNETKDWLRQKLKEQHLKDSIFIVREYITNIRIDDKTIQSKRIINEEKFRLD